LCFVLSVSLTVFLRERNSPPPAVGCFVGVPPGLSRKGTPPLGGRGETPFVLFICQNETQRDDFLACADHELTGHRWHPSHPVREHEYIARRHILFCDERDIHLGKPRPRRLAPYPPGHPGRCGRDAKVRGVPLPCPRGGATSQPVGSEPGPTANDERVGEPGREAA
jgi:hypothetical protein